MSILRSKEKTYPFTLEGMAQMKADENKYNMLNDHDLLISGLVLGISVAGLCLLCAPLSSVVAYKAAETELISKVAFKAISTIL